MNPSFNRKPTKTRSLKRLIGLAAFVGSHFLSVLGFGQGFQEPGGLEPQKGIFLIAQETMQDPRFHQTVILLVRHNENGTMGLIINRLTDHPLSTVLPDLESDGAEKHRLYLGGPVGLNGLMFLTRSDQPIEGVAPVVGNIYFGGKREILQKFVRKKMAPDQLRVYAGYSGWAQGQLDFEIERGSWHLVRADEGSVFDKDPEDVWGDLIGNLLRRRFMAQSLRPAVPTPAVATRGAVAQILLAWPLHLQALSDVSK